MSQVSWSVALTPVLLLAACDSSPGPLTGTWKAGGLAAITLTFRSGEMESMGMIEKVAYKVDGNSVIVTMKDGMMKGTAVRYVVVNPTTRRALLTRPCSV